MPIKNTTIYTRPDTANEFWTFTDAEKLHIDSTYIGPGMLTPGVTQLSQDTLTRTRIVTWLDQASIDAYFADPIVAAAYKEREKYCRAHSHTKSSTNQDL
jgi:quinol monooxygenase YgiN